MQFTGPFRIEKIVRSAVHLKNLDGTPADTQNVRNVYPYNRENDHILQDFDHALLDDDDRDKFEAGDMCIVDLTDDDGTPNWGLAKISAVKPQNPKEEFHLHWFGTYSKAKSLAKRAYAPAYIDSRDDLEIYKWKKTKTLEEMTMRVHRSELRFYPFSLTNKNEIPVKIVKELVTDGYAVMMISTVN
mmetsp:Transcript_8107/g.22791  ORF Transcript_8107/g.22791 Transcript_8107/m.22791 type:complete len:187 (-) Transcript_8107:300-860(-)